MDTYVVRVRRYETVMRDCEVIVEALCPEVAKQKALRTLQAGADVSWEEERRGNDANLMVLSAELYDALIRKELV